MMNGRIVSPAGNNRLISLCDPIRRYGKIRGRIVDEVLISAEEKELVFNDSSTDIRSKPALVIVWSARQEYWPSVGETSGIGWTVEDCILKNP
jgi:hypothetical protein